MPDYKPYRQSKSSLSTGSGYMGIPATSSSSSSSSIRSYGSSTSNGHHSDVNVNSNGHSSLVPNSAYSSRYSSTALSTPTTTYTVGRRSLTVTPPSTSTITTSSYQSYLLPSRTTPVSNTSSTNYRHTLSSLGIPDTSKQKLIPFHSCLPIETIQLTATELTDLCTIITLWLLGTCMVLSLFTITIISITIPDCTVELIRHCRIATVCSQQAIQETNESREKNCPDKTTTATTATTTSITTNRILSLPTTATNAVATNAFADVVHQVSHLLANVSKW